MNQQNRPAEPSVPRLNKESLSYENFLVILRDHLIYLWLIAKESCDLSWTKDLVVEHNNNIRGIEFKVMEGGTFPTPPPCWFSFINSDTVKAVTLAFIIDICAKFGIPNSPHFPDIGQNPDGGVSGFRISSQSLIKGNCQNTRTN